MHEHIHPISNALLTLFRSMASAPEKLTFSEQVGVNQLEITIEPAMQDIRLMIGKQGKTIMAIRQVAERMGRKIGLEVKLEVRDSFRGDPEPERRPFQTNRAWSGSELTNLLRRFLDLIYDRTIRIVYEDKGDQLYVILDVPQN